MANKVQCSEKVWDGWHKRDCHRPAGYGEGAAYCKQHAKRYPSVDEVAAGEMKYWAEWTQYGYPSLARVVVIKETDKAFVTTEAGKVNLIGSVFININGTVRKEDGYLTDYLEDACEYLRKEATRRVSLALAMVDSVQKRAAEVREDVKRVLKESQEVAQEVQRGSTK